jgi:hypothetical protein
MGRTLSCIVCGGAALPYARGDWCDEHLPFPRNPTPDPERTLDALIKKKKPFKTYHKYGNGNAIIKKSKWVK